MTTTTDAPGHRVETIADLEAIYGTPSRRSLVKELDHLSAHYRAFVEAAPFLVIASIGPEGLDTSPRGDPAGFVRVPDDRTLMIPDRRGNNRLDTLRNIVTDPRISLIFLIPGVGETLRVNGTARLTADPDLRATFAMEGKAPATIVIVSVERVYFQCQKALHRSRLWDPDARIDRATLPTAGDILAAIDEGFDGKAYDAEYPERMKRTAY